jgi:hypothetical protein
MSVRQIGSSESIRSPNSNGLRRRVGTGSILGRVILSSPLSPHPGLFPFRESDPTADAVGYHLSVLRTFPGRRGLLLPRTRTRTRFPPPLTVGIGIRIVPKHSLPRDEYNPNPAPIPQSLCAPAPLREILLALNLSPACPRFPEARRAGRREPTASAVGHCVENNEPRTGRQNPSSPPPRIERPLSPHPGLFPFRESHPTADAVGYHLSVLRTFPGAASLASHPCSPAPSAPRPYSYPYPARRAVLVLDSRPAHRRHRNLQRPEYEDSRYAPRGIGRQNGKQV